MKGFVEGVTWTAIVLIAGIVAFIVLLAIWIFFLLPFTPGKPFSFDITFVDLVNRPYLLTSSVGNKQFNDRIFFEHALEAAVVESLENSNSENLQTLVEDYMEFYDLKYYSISVKKGSNKIFEINNLPKTCDINAFCVPKYYETDAGTCNVGRIEIEQLDPNLKCNSDRICCKEDKEAYSENPDNFAVIPCGKDSIGMCSSEADFFSWAASYVRKFPCGEGRIEIEDVADNCKDINDGKTPMCCAPVAAGTISVGKAFSAKIPLLYKDEQAILEVSVE